MRKPWDLHLLDGSDKPVVDGSGSPIIVADIHKTEILAAQFLENSSATLISASKGGEIILWELDGNKFHQLAYYKVPGETLLHVVASHNGRYFAAINGKGEFYLYKIPVYRSWEGLKEYARAVVKGQSLTQLQKKVFHIHDAETE